VTKPIRAAWSAWSAWCRFWFETPKPEAMRLFRVVLASMLFLFFLIRSLDLTMLFADSGILPRAIVGDVMPPDGMRFRLSVLSLSGADSFVWAVHGVFLASLAALALGRWPTTAAIVAFVLHVSFIHRNMASVFGIDLISTFFLLYLCLAEYGSAPAGSLRRELGCVAQRLCQLQVCIIYAYSGWEKLKGQHWWKGEAIWDVLANAQLARFDFSFLSHVPLLVVGATYATLAWETYFPVLIWNPRLRNPMLIGGVFLHLGIAVAVNIPFFGMLMIVAYLPFLDEKLSRRLLSFLPSAVR
jgi:hypothetical protein